MAHIHRVNFSCAVVQQHIGKATGGSAHIQCNQAGGVEFEMFNGMGQFQAAARNPRMRRLGCNAG